MELKKYVRANLKSENESRNNSYYLREKERLQILGADQYKQLSGIKVINRDELKSKLHLPSGLFILNDWKIVKDVSITFTVFSSNGILSCIVKLIKTFIGKALANSFAVFE